MFPAIDIAGYKRRTVLPAEYVDGLETRSPGFVAQAIASLSSRIYSQLRKRYGTSPNAGASIPFGQSAPPLTAAGTSPPGVSLSGAPRLGSYVFHIQVTTPGALGVAVVQWSSDGGITWTTGVLTAATVILGQTGVTAAFAAGIYAADNVYVSSTPVPETFLGWLTALLDLRMMRKRGADPDAPEMKLLVDEAQRALAEIEQAANGQDGLFDLPAADGADSAVSTGGMLSYGESSPFVGADQQQTAAMIEDYNGVGTYGGA